MKKIIILILFLWFDKIAICQKGDSIIKPPAILNPNGIFKSDSANGFKLRRKISDFGNYDNVIGQTFKDFSAKDITGKVFTTQNLSGKISLINFSFSTCAPCIPEYVKLNQLYLHYLPNSNFQLLSFTFDDSTEARRTSEKYGLSYSIISVSNKLCSELIFGYGYPSNFLIDENCKVVFGHTGASTRGTNTEPFGEILIPKIDSLLLILKNIK